MWKKLKWKSVLVILIAALAIWFSYPPLDVLDKEGNVAKEGTLNLGLDLQGGMHMVLHVDTSKLTPNEAKDAPARALEVIRKEIAVQERLMDELWVQIEALELRQAVELKAPFDGIVVPLYGRAGDVVLRRSGESILRRQGEVVLAGEPILAIAEATPREIIAYISEEQADQVQEGTAVELVKKRTQKITIAKSRIAYVGPTIERKPERLWQNPAIPEWGLPISIKIPSGMELVSGELVGIRRL